MPRGLRRGRGDVRRARGKRRTGRTARRRPHARTHAPLPAPPARFGREAGLRGEGLRLPRSAARSLQAPEARAGCPASPDGAIV